MVSENRENMITPKIHLTEARRTQREKKFEFLRALRASVRVSSSLLILFALFSCQTAPKTPDFSLGGHLPLEPGGYVYLLAEKDALPVLEQFMFNNINDKQFQQMVDMTRFAAAAVYVTPNEKTGALTSRYRLAAWGSYPSSRAKMALGSSKEWQKRRSAVSGADYWYSPQSGYSVAITAGMTLAATAAKSGDEAPDPFSAAPGTALPEGFMAFREGSILSCWLNNPALAINQKLSLIGIPLEIPAQQLFVSLFPVDDRYAAHLQIQLDNASQAQALVMMFTLMRNFIPLQADANSLVALLPSILFANPPVQDGNNLNITTAPLTVQEIALLLKFFSL
jgi:hypothetical protein